MLFAAPRAILARMRKLLLAAATIAAVALAAPAAALDTRTSPPASPTFASGPTMNNTLTLWVLPVSYYYYGDPVGWGFGGRYQLEIVPQGFLPRKFKDELGLEFGLDYANFGGNPSWNELTPVVGVVWNVWFTHWFAVYPKIDTGWRVGWWTSSPHPDVYGSGFLIEGAAGVIFKVANSVMLRGEVGSYGLRLGVAFSL